MLKLVPLTADQVPTPAAVPYQAGTTLVMPTGEVITAFNNSLMLTLPTGGHHDLGIKLDPRGDNPTFLLVDGGRRLLLTTLWGVWDVAFASARATQLIDATLPLATAVPATGGGILTMHQAPYQDLAYWQRDDDGDFEELWEFKLPDGAGRISACGDLPAVLVHGDGNTDEAWLVAFDTAGPRPVASLSSNVAGVVWDTDTRRLLLLPLGADGEPGDTWHLLEGAEAAIGKALRADPSDDLEAFEAPRVLFDGDADTSSSNGSAHRPVWATVYDRANGLSLDRCVFPAWRFDAATGIVPGQSETWLMASERSNDSLDVHGHIPSKYHYVATWMTEAGGVFVADRLNSSVYYSPDFDAAKGGKWQHHHVPMHPLGLCGTPDGGMFVWGSFHSACLLFSWNGQGFDLMPVPGFAIHAMHGRHANALWAAGALGMVAFWNGETWTSFKTETNEFLNSIFMCEDGRVYATGSWGSLVRGGIDRGQFEPWITMIDGPSAGTRFHGVVHWQGAVWLAAAEQGLMRLPDGGENLQLFGPECTAIGLHARERLIVTCPNMLMDTADGKKWRMAFEGALLAKTTAPAPAAAATPETARPAPETAEAAAAAPEPVRPAPETPAAEAPSHAVPHIDDDTYYIGASGTSIFNCIFRGFRFDPRKGYIPQESEAWVMMLDDDGGQVRTTAHLPRHARLSGVVRMPDGEVIAADATHRSLHTTPHLDAVRGGHWTEKRLPIAPQGLVLLPDETLVTWGPSDVGESVLLRTRGTWDSLYALDFEIRCIHGTGVGNLWVGGVDGRVHAWDGDRWHDRPLPLRHTVTDLHVRRDGIVFAVTDRGAVLIHDAHGWHAVGQGPAQGAELFAVTWWRDAVWIAAGPHGLWRNRPGSWDFEVVKTSVHATGLVAGERLLITTATRIVDTDDGVNFRAAAEGMLKTRTQGMPLGHFVV
jgi:hypothetical protein